MAETIGDTHLSREIADPEQESELQYARSSLHADARRELYKYSPSGRNIWKEIADKIDLQQNDWMLDVGIGKGFFLDEIIRPKIEERFSSSFAGSILGIDKYTEDFFATWQEISARNPLDRIQFAYGDAEELHYPENSIDIISALFLLYHIKDPGKFLDAAKRILKPGGKLIVATRGQANLQRLWQLGGLIAERVNAVLPPTFYQRFDLDTAERELASRFVIEHQEIQDEPLPVPFDHEVPGDGEGWRDYRQALFSFKDIMVNQNDINDPAVPRIPRGGSIKGVVDGEVKAIFQAEVTKRLESTGESYFEDRIQQGYFICRNVK